MNIVAELIKHPDRKRQIVDFAKLRFGSCMPTDLDGFLEKNDNLFMFYEFKHREAELSEAQESAYKKLVDIVASTGRMAVLFVCRHTVDDPHQDIDAANTIVGEYYHSHYWWPGNNRTVKELSDKFYDWFIINRDMLKQGVSTEFEGQNGFLSVSEIEELENAH